MRTSVLTYMHSKVGIDKTSDYIGHLKTHTTETFYVKSKQLMLELQTGYPDIMDIGGSVYFENRVFS